jgi:hypothetical protein
VPCRELDRRLGRLADHSLGGVVLVGAAETPTILGRALRAFSGSAGKPAAAVDDEALAGDEAGGL